MATIKGYTPHDKQKNIHSSINNENYKYYVLNIGRQFGKTMLGINQMLYWAINDKGCNIAWVTPIYKQGKKVFDEFEKVTIKSGLFEYNRSDLTIQGFGSTINFFSGERPDNIRGNTFDYLIIDEMAFTRPELWSEVLSATVLVKGKKVIFISTPKGKNHFNQLALQHNYDNRYKYFHFTSYDNPMIDVADLDERKRNLPDHIFRQEYLAEFLDNASGLFKDVRKAVSNNFDSNEVLFGGLDIGRADDYTVLTIINRSQQMVYVERWRQDDWTNIINKVAEVINRFKAKTYVEVNNQGDVFYEMLKKHCDELIEPYVTSSKTKPIMIEDLALAFEQGNITILNEGWLIDELEAFTYIYDERTRGVKYSAPQGLHDDAVISLSLAIQSRKNLLNSGHYFIR
ncbi:large terminase protein [uncultured Caudovirales phage]|uniref:Large terminase protein n=1 Tax=uncultured Caudovirales phage TaxID=2100421 RepID=A0A6J5N9G6_9CAUD|nr:large terminase protein [uncultured Caudovirales phage]